MPYSFVGESRASPDPLRSPLAPPIHHLRIVYGGLAGAGAGEVYLGAIFFHPHTLPFPFNLLIQSSGDKYNPHFLSLSLPFCLSLLVPGPSPHPGRAGKAQRACDSWGDLLGGGALNSPRVLQKVPRELGHLAGARPQSAPLAGGGTHLPVLWICLEPSSREPRRPLSGEGGGPAGCWGLQSAGAGDRVWACKRALRKQEGDEAFNILIKCRGTWRPPCTRSTTTPSSQ